MINALAYFWGGRHQEWYCWDASPLHDLENNAGQATTWFLHYPVICLTCDGGRDHSLVAHAFMHASLNGRMSTGFACLEVYPVPITFLAMVHLTGCFSFWRLKLVVSSCSLPPLPSEAPSVTHVNYALYSSTSLTRNLHDKQELMDWPHGPLLCCLWLPVPLLLDRHPKIIIVVFALISSA